MGKLTGKVAVVTGASDGIGASIALHLAAEGIDEAGGGHDWIRSAPFIPPLAPPYKGGGFMAHVGAYYIQAFARAQALRSWGVSSSRFIVGRISCNRPVCSSRSAMELITRSG